MQKIRETNDYRINLSILQKLFVIAVGFPRGVSLLESSTACFIEIGAGTKIRDAARAQRFRVHLTRPSRANNSDIQLRHVDLIGCRSCRAVSSARRVSASIREFASSIVVAV